jgi:hypothetical protein
VPALPSRSNLQAGPLQSPRLRRLALSQSDSRCFKAMRHVGSEDPSFQAGSAESGPDFLRREPKQAAIPYNFHYRNGGLTLNSVVCVDIS